ncbi:MAG: alpha/beta hydrolase family protein [Alphaproteobacteria bacterium]
MNKWLLAYRLAATRRLSLLLTGDFDPYPKPPDDVALSPSEGHLRAYDHAPLALSWRRAGGADPLVWQARARAKLAELMGYRRPESGPTARHGQSQAVKGGLRAEKFYLGVREGVDVPVIVVSDRHSRGPRPVMLCLQGTNSGAHLSWGEARMPADPLRLANGADYARQAVREGYVALCVEQACFGERRERRLRPRSPDPCIDAANHALLIGRTLLGERVMDLSSVINWLESERASFGLDMTRVHVLGQSAGATVALHAAALDGRIGAVLASGSVGYIRATIGRRRDGEGQNTIPGILDWLEYDDVVALTAPRPFLTVSGTRDHIFPFSGAARVVEAARAVYWAMGAERLVQAVAAEGPHRFYPDVAWPAWRGLLAEGTAKAASRDGAAKGK